MVEVHIHGKDQNAKEPHGIVFEDEAKADTFYNSVAAAAKAAGITEDQIDLQIRGTKTFTAADSETIEQTMTIKKATSDVELAPRPVKEVKITEPELLDEPEI